MQIPVAIFHEDAVNSKPPGITNPASVEVYWSTQGILISHNDVFVAGEPDKELNPKQKVWEQVQPDLRTDGQCVATYKGAAFEVAGKGVCKAQTMSDCEIK